MKTVFIVMLLVGLSAGAFGLISITVDKHMSTDKKHTPYTGAVPSIDSDIPVGIETATFALG
ncbi:MAG: hypothetical protein C4581_03980 [Nitrospiraceae bacterium]|nr:MAG: hypothetical protein C4581_03980 [Nitrospiraceae bacterium]